VALLSFQKPVHAACLKHIYTNDRIEFAGLKIHAPAVVSASVSSGKSVMIAELADAIHKAAEARGNKVRILVIQRISILCEQNSQAAWSIECQNSIYSASAYGGMKSTTFDVIFCTEGTMARALDTKFCEEMPWRPDVVLIDECHMVNFDDPESQFLKILLHFYKLKPHMRLIGYTGSPFRGTDSIVGPFWSKFLSIEADDPLYPEGGTGNGLVTTEEMINGGWVVSPTFGLPTVHGYDFSSVDWTVDDEKELNRLTESEQLLAEILSEVIDIAQTRKGVLIFASTKRHAGNIVKMLERLGVYPATIGLIVDSTSEKEKTRILKAAQTGEIKYAVNVGVLTTGINCAYWDLLVFLRPIGSLTLLIQAIGRVLRLLIGPNDMPMVERDSLTADERKDLIAASDKPDALILDYANVMDRLGKLYENPVLEQAELERAKKQHETILCPECGEENSMHARRCISMDRNTKKRCEHFWSFRLCPHCGEKNDVVARQCRNTECACELIDPNEKLDRKHYKDGEAIPVVSMDLETGKGGALYVKWLLSDGAKHLEIYYPNYGAKAAINTTIWYQKFVKEHVEGSKGQSMARRMTAQQAVAMKSIFRVPTHLAARKNDKGKSNIGRRIFAVEQLEEMA
jgi:superfamily II DNA or RNA helicase